MQYDKICAPLKCKQINEALSNNAALLTLLYVRVGILLKVQKRMISLR